MEEVLVYNAVGLLQEIMCLYYRTAKKIKQRHRETVVDCDFSNRLPQYLASILLKYNVCIPYGLVYKLILNLIIVHSVHSLPCVVSRF